MGDTSKNPKKLAISIKVADRNREWYMEWLRGKSATQIAKECGAKRTTVANGLIQARKERVTTQQATIEEECQEARDRCDAIYQEAMAAWRVSKDAGEPDPRFLAVAQRAEERKSRLLGLNAPEKQDISGMIGLAGHATVEVQESADWYGIRHPEVKTIEASHQPSNGHAASVSDPDQPGPVQGGDVWPTVGQNGSGLNGHAQGPREPPGDVPGGD